MRALLITRQGVQVVEIGPEAEKLYAVLQNRSYDNPDQAILQSMYRLMECTTVTGAGYPNATHACWADDEGLLTAGPGTQVTLVSWWGEPLVGKLLVTGFDPETGDTTPATMSVTELTTMIKLGELKPR